MDAISIIGQLEIGKLSLRAGDVLVARYVGRLRPEEAARIRSALEAKLPEGVGALVIDQDFELSTIEGGRGFV